MATMIPDPISIPIQCLFRISAAIYVVTASTKWFKYQVTFVCRKQANGVKPIKHAFIEKLNQLGWEDEKIVSKKSIKNRKIDSSLELSDGKYFGVEWETGNIASSHRAINRLKLGMLEGDLAGGFLVLPSRQMYYYLTERVGNSQELEKYFPVMSDTSKITGFLGVIEIEHDGVRADIPPIKKGTDGRALV
ncbi:hypothetical protein [Thermoactinomyces sp. AS95]|uniref:hypothetical protein n=1 Tax=Thermoactinomyces sp. AS95 TaxID=1811386 RepID=UPI0018D39CF7|nr:hypothetical protein [Thermoactinomyces sp. AS95]